MKKQQYIAPLSKNITLVAENMLALSGLKKSDTTVNGADALSNDRAWSNDAWDDTDE